MCCTYIKAQRRNQTSKRQIPKDVFRIKLLCFRAKEIRKDIY